MTVWLKIDKLSEVAAIKENEVAVSIHNHLAASYKDVSFKEPESLSGTGNLGTIFCHAETILLNTDRWLE